MDPEQLARTRAEYAAEGLDESTAGSDPVALFGRWLDAAVASGLHEPNAMALSTATPDGAPSVRLVLLKGFDARGATFFTSYDSRKGEELTLNPRAALAMLWHPLQRQVRIEGPVVRVSAAESDAYFASRPRGAQIGAVSSPQSRAVADRAALEQRYAQVEDAAGDGEIARPEHWGGYRVVPEVMEFWHGRASRMHDRILFTRDGDGWVRGRLAP